MNRFTAISAVMGFALVVAGAAIIYRPLGLIVAGALFFALTFFTARRKPRAS